MSKRRIGVIMGGTSAERDVSLRSGIAVAAALEERGHERRAASSSATAATPVWRYPPIRHRRRVPRARTGASAKTAACRACSSSRHPVHGLERARERARDGQAQGEGAVPPPQRPDAARTTRSTADDDLADLEELHGSFGFPVIVKPRGEGSSLGVTQGDARSPSCARARSRASSSTTRRSRRALHRGARDQRRHPRRPRARRHRDRARRAASTTTRRSTRRA